MLYKDSSSQGSLMITVVEQVMTNHPSLPGIVLFYHRVSFILQKTTPTHSTLSCPVQGNPERLVTLDDLQSSDQTKPCT